MQEGAVPLSGSSLAGHSLAMNGARTPSGSSLPGDAQQQGSTPGSGSVSTKNGGKFPFTLETPGKSCVFWAATAKERDAWVAVIKVVLDRPMTPQDSSREYIYTVRWSNFEHGDPKVVVFLMSTEAPPAGIF